jgi:hypothetical protein
MKVILTAIILLFLGLTTTNLVTAAPYNPLGGACSGSAATSAACTNNTTDPVSGTDGVIYKVTQLVVFATSIVAVLMIMIGGFTYIMSSGDPQKISAAKNTIIYAIIGLIVAVSAQLIIKFVLQSIG